MKTLGLEPHGSYGQHDREGGGNHGQGGQADPVAVLPQDAPVAAPIPTYSTDQATALIALQPTSRR